MENLLELEQIVLLSTPITSTNLDEEKQYTVNDVKDLTKFNKSLPIFTAPLESIVGKSSVNSYLSNLIRPIIPVTENLKDRLSYCIGVFCSFTLEEVKKEFLEGNNYYRRNNYQYHVCIETELGHGNELFSVCIELKKIYGSSILLMGGPLTCPSTYSSYSKAGFDYVRVGTPDICMNTRETFGFRYPLASLLIGIQQYKKTSGIGLKEVKIIADDDLTSPSEILKALALGADYVMCGRIFAGCLEAEGPIIQKSKGPDGNGVFENNISKDKLIGINGAVARLNGYKRRYYGNIHPELCSRLLGFSRKDWNNLKNKSDYIKPIVVEIDTTISDWVNEFKRVINYGFVQTNSRNWTQFKSNILWGKSEY